MDGLSKNRAHECKYKEEDRRMKEHFINYDGQNYDS